MFQWLSTRKHQEVVIDEFKRFLHRNGHVGQDTEPEPTGEFKPVGEHFGSGEDLDVGYLYTACILQVYCTARLSAARTVGTAADVAESRAGSPRSTRTIPRGPHTVVALIYHSMAGTF